MAAGLPSAEHSLRMLYQSQNRALLSTTELTHASFPSVPPTPLAPAPSASFPATDFLPRSFARYNAMAAPHNFGPASAPYGARAQPPSCINGAPPPTVASSGGSHPILPHPQIIAHSNFSYQGAGMDPFVHLEGASFSPSVDSPYLCAVPSGVHSNAFAFDPDDSMFSVKAGPNYPGVSAGYTPGLSQGSFDFSNEVHDISGHGLMTREQRREMNLSSPDASGSASGGSSAPSPTYNLNEAAPYPSSGDGHHQPPPGSGGFGSGFGLASRGGAHRRYGSGGNEYISEADEPRDYFEELLNGAGVGLGATGRPEPRDASAMMVDMEGLGSALARRVSRDSRSSWDSSGAEDSESWSVGSLQDQQYPFLSSQGLAAFGLGRQGELFPPANSISQPPSSPSPVMYRSASHHSDLSCSSQDDLARSLAVNPNDVNPHSQPVTPAEKTSALTDDPLERAWWDNGQGSRSVDALADGLSLGMAFQQTVRGGPGGFGNGAQESTLRAKERTRETLAGVFGSHFTTEQAADGSSPAPGPSVTPVLSSSLPDGTWSKSRGARSTRTTAQRASSRASPLHSTRPAASRGSAGSAAVAISSYANLPTRNSRGRRPVTSTEVGLAPADGTLEPQLQAVPGGSAFDPSLNPTSKTVEYCQTTKTGKPKKLFVCQVIGCGKVFRRGEHLKRHVRSIHTTSKPFACPWRTCDKLFNRHDNLNQHMRVHKSPGERTCVLDGLTVGSDGVLRRGEDGARIDPASLGLRNVELALRGQEAGVDLEEDDY